jgi:hypothetical protein
MHFQKSILSILTVTSLTGHLANLFGQPNPTMIPSTVCLNANEQVFLYGTGFNHWERGPNRRWLKSSADEANLDSVNWSRSIYDNYLKDF